MDWPRGSKDGQAQVPLTSSSGFLATDPTVHRPPPGTPKPGKDTPVEPQPRAWRERRHNSGGKAGGSRGAARQSGRCSRPRCRQPPGAAPVPVAEPAWSWPGRRRRLERRWWAAVGAPGGGAEEGGSQAPAGLAGRRSALQSFVVVVTAETCWEVGRPVYARKPRGGFGSHANHANVRNGCAKLFFLRLFQ